MFRDKFCSVTQQVHVKHRRTNSQFLKTITHEEQLKRNVRAQEILMTAENPIVNEQKLNSQLCIELHGLEKEKFLEEKRKALLHQNEDEIKLLDTQIQRAHIQRELTEQKALKEKQVKEDLKARLEENRLFEEECQKNAAIAREQDRKDLQKKAAFRQDILRQMEERDKKRQMEKEITQKDRQSMKRYFESFQQDTDNERQHIIKLKETGKQERDEYLRQAELYKSQRKLDAQEDYRNYMEMIRQQDEAERLRIEKMKDNFMKRAALSERIGQQVYALQMEKQKHNDQLLELLIEERLAKDDERYKMNLEKQFQTARSMHDDFQRSRLLRQQEKLHRRKEEMNAVREQFKIFQEQEHQELDKRNFNLQKSRQYRQELLHTMANKTSQLEFEALQNKHNYEHQIALQQKRRQEIESEKLRLLRAEPLEILKFLPVKAISDAHRLALGLTCKETTEKI